MAESCPLQSVRATSQGSGDQKPLISEANEQYTDDALMDKKITVGHKTFIVSKGGAGGLGGRRTTQL